MENSTPHQQLSLQMTVFNEFKCMVRRATLSPGYTSRVQMSEVARERGFRDGGGCFYALMGTPIGMKNSRYSMHPFALISAFANRAIIRKTSSLPHYWLSKARCPPHDTCIRADRGFDSFRLSVQRLAGICRPPSPYQSHCSNATARLTCALRGSTKKAGDDRLAIHQRLRTDLHP